ncbi:MAG TPA: helix-turn-helix transcriptional regulator [Anaerolineae bacterium]|nr:helix-turn-helix transcriptional regulator [Anaerolineae bacterium]
MEASQAIAIRNKIVGILVRRARLRAGKSQRECAEFLAISSHLFAEYEQGRRGLSLPHLEALAYFLQVPMVSLWDENHVLPEEKPQEPVPIAAMIQLRTRMLAVQFRQCRHSAGLTQQQMADLLGCSAYKISQYEAGRREISLAELEMAAEQCGQSLADLCDEAIVPLGRAELQRQLATRLDELPSDLRDFVLKPTNTLYLRIAMLLSTMKADSLRQIAETLLDITY